MAKRKKKNNNFIILICFCLLAVFSINGLVGLLTGRGVEKQPQNSTVSTAPSPTPEVLRTEEPDKQEEQPPAPQKPTADKYSVLVNVEHPLSSDFDVQTRKIKNTEKLFDVTVADKLEAMLTDAANRGCPMLLVSTYRTIRYQQGLYSKKVNEYLGKGYSQDAAEAEAAKWVAIPGTSEHNTGLVADIVSSDWYNKNNDLEQTFENTKHFEWLISHCADYGFILRYPKGKEAVTGIVYEPWHYRYVGTELAHYLMDNDLTLEEYWEI